MKTWAKKVVGIALVFFAPSVPARIYDGLALALVCQRVRDLDHVVEKPVAFGARFTALRAGS